MICIALLRAVNVGGRNLVSMPELCRLFETSGFANARSLLASGNVVFDSNLKTSSRIETALEAATQKRLHVDVDFIVRTAGEWKAIVEGNPFPREAKEDPGHLLVMCLKNAPGARRSRIFRPPSKAGKVCALSADRFISPTRTALAAPS